MGEVCSNLPANIVGPFSQTLFLGCTVKSFSSSVGWNDQETSVTVELVQDTCAPAAGSTKYYYPKPGIVNTWNAADPGFQIPDVGAPVYFRVGDFEFAGLVRSWSEKQDSSNFPAYSVTISDPRFILENLTIITGQYADEVKNVPNLVNAYGFLESISDEVCQLDDELQCRDCDDTFINGAQFGSPAEGFGGANQNDEGVPWIRLREAITLLLSGTSNEDYSPRGYAVFRGHTPVGIPAPANGMGRLPYDDFNSQIISDFNGNGYINQYIVDITEIPFAPTYYRIESTSQTLLSLISQVCSDAGCDFYIELIITGAGEKVIKIRTVKRRSQPDLGQITQFLNTQNDYLISRNYGNELRNEPTSVFIYGDNVQSLYEVVPTGAGGKLLEYDPTSPVIQHWGINSLGDFNSATVFSGDRYFQTGLVEWDVNLDIRPLQRTLTKPLSDLLGLPMNTATLSETEIRAAMGSFQAWYNYTLFVGVTGYEDDFTDASYGTTFGSFLKLPANFGTSLPFGGLKGKLPNQAPSNVVVGSIPSVVIDYSGSLKKPTGDVKKDLEAIHGYIKAFGDKHYGKEYVVKMPEICYYKDSQRSRDNGREVFNFSDNPTDSAYPASGVSGVLGLDLDSTGIEIFEEEDTFKINGISRYYLPSTGAVHPKSGSLVLDGGNQYSIFETGLYTSLTAEAKTYLYPTGGGKVPAAIVSIDGAVFSGEPESVKYNGAYFIEKMPGGSGALPSGVTTSGDIFGSTLRKAMGVMPQSYFPSGFAIPMFSNTNRYGPWGFVGPEGPVKFEEDKDLAPWNYGGYDLLNSGAIEKVQDGLTFQQVGERGGFTLVGYPVKSLGQDLRSPQTSYSSFVLQDGTSNYGDYKYINTTPMDGSFGPNITSINVSIGEGGATTTYELATFTPSFGRMSKLNANRLKEIKKIRADNKKRDRETKKLLNLQGKLGKGNPGFSALISTLAQDVQSLIPEDQKNQVKDLIVGSTAVVEDAGDIQDEDLCIAGGSDNQILSKQQSMNDEQFQKTAVMSQEGFFRSVSKSGDGGLPGYIQTTETVEGNEAHSQDPMGPINEWTMPIVARDYLDPMASENTPKHCTDANIYHDINQCAFGDSINQSGGYGTTTLRDYIAKGNSCPDDFRFMALRGPLVINGWGYDLQGKPIPNEADSVENARSGIYTSSNLKDRFLPNWLKKSRTWPTAPVDLKFDRKRGVWTVPNSFRIVQVTASGDIDPGNSGTAGVSNPTTIYDGEGVSVDTQTIALNVPSWMPSGVASGNGAYAFYDTSDSKWYAIFDTLGSGSGGGGGGGTTPKYKDTSYCDYSATYTTCTGVSCLTFGEGLQFDGSAVSAPLLHVEGDWVSCNSVAAPEFDATKILFSDNLIATRAGCIWTVKGADQKISSTRNDAVTDCMGQAANVAATNFTKLAFTDNIGVEMGVGVDTCTATIKGLDQKIKSTLQECIAGSETINPAEPFTQLTFSNNIGVTQNNCEFTIEGLNQKIQGTTNALIAGSETFNNQTFTKLTFSDNIGVDQTNCDFEIKGLDQKIAANGNCSTNIVAETDFTNLNFGSGLYLTSTAAGNYRIDKKLTFVDADGTTLSNGVSKVTAGCGISVAGSACDITISLDKDASPGAEVDVQVVKDICCSGSGLNIVYKTLRFTSCGLFSGVVDEGSC